MLSASPPLTPVGPHGCQQCLYSPVFKVRTLPVAMIAGIVHVVTFFRFALVLWAHEYVPEGRISR